MASTKILLEFAKTFPQIHTSPEKYLGPNFEKVLEFWELIDGISPEQVKEIGELWNSLEYFERGNAVERAEAAAKSIVGEVNTLEAWWAAAVVSIFGDATLELIGDVDNKVFYNLIISYKNS